MKEGYKIVITKYYDVAIKRSEYIGKKDERADEDGYVYVPKIERREDEIYMQRAEDIDLNAIIKAVNEKASESE